MMKKEDVMELIDMTKLTNMINGLKDKEIVVSIPSTGKRLPVWLV